MFKTIMKRLKKVQILPSEATKKCLKMTEINAKGPTVHCTMKIDLEFSKIFFSFKTLLRSANLVIDIGMICRNCPDVVEY